MRMDDGEAILGDGRIKMDKYEQQVGNLNITKDCDQLYSASECQPLHFPSRDHPLQPQSLHGHHEGFIKRTTGLLQVRELSNLNIMLHYLT